MVNITNESDVSSYSSLNKMYIPDDYINTSFNYYFNGDYINIITPNDCYTNYNSTYCTCYMYNRDHNVVSEAYSCNTNTSLPKISMDSITSDINYSKSIKNDYYSSTIIYLLMFILALVFARMLTRERSHL